MNNNKLQKIIQGGAVGLCILTLALAGYMARETFKLMTNHIQASIKAQYELKDSVDRLDRSVEELADVLKNNKR
jgi:hypothetical protein